MNAYIRNWTLPTAHRSFSAPSLLVQLCEFWAADAVEILSYCCNFFSFYYDYVPFFIYFFLFILSPLRRHETQNDVDNQFYFIFMTCMNTPSVYVCIYEYYLRKKKH